MCVKKLITVFVIRNKNVLNIREINVFDVNILRMLKTFKCTNT